MILIKTVSIPFSKFMATSTLGYTTFYDLPLMEGIVGFGMLGVVLLVLSQLEDRVNSKVVNGGLLVGFLIGLLLLLFKSMNLIGF